MNGGDSASTFKLTIDRIVIDGVSGEFVEERFREQLSEELQRLLSRPEVVEGLREGRVEEGLTRSVDSSELNDPARVARHLIWAIQPSGE
jgi:hypothetical protein